MTSYYVLGNNASQASASAAVDPETVAAPAPVTSVFTPTVDIPASALSEDDIILYVGPRGTKFYASISALTAGCDYLKVRFSNNWSSIKDNGQGTKHCFINADAEVFPLILRYLESGRMPLLWDNETKKFDLPTYARLLEQAHRLCIPEMIKWLTNAEWEKAITIERRAQIENRPWTGRGGPENELLDTSGAETVQVETHWVWETDYPCPSGLHPRRHNHFPCEQSSCVQARVKWGDNKNPQSVEVNRPKLTTVREKVVFHPEALDPNNNADTSDGPGNEGGNDGAWNWNGAETN